jgi:hypothetical protein
MTEELLATPSASLKAVLLFVHVIGVALGLGAATLIDLLVVRMLVAGKIAPSQPGFIQFASAIVPAGLALLWLSGLGLLAYYSAFDLAALQNPKVWTKVAIVAVLTLNGLFIHAVVLPLIARQTGRRLFDGISEVSKSLLLTAGAVSITSWYVPLFLAVSKPMNFVVPAQAILGSYVVLLAVAVIASQLLARILAPRAIHVLRGQSKPVFGHGEIAPDGNRRSPTRQRRSVKSNGSTSMAAASGPGASDS